MTVQEEVKIYLSETERKCLGEAKEMADCIYRSTSDSKYEKAAAEAARSIINLLYLCEQEEEKDEYKKIQ